MSNIDKSYLLSRNINIRKNKYIDFKINGRLFPSWVLANFKHYKLPEIIKQDDVDPCKVKTKLALRKYQLFISKFLDFNSPYHDLILYHGLGSGKTASAINVYNMLYNYTPGWNVIILLKASMRHSIWLPELEKWLNKDEYKYRFKNIHFVHYDAPNADKSFLDTIKSIDSSKKSMYIIEECHNFINNVYSNINSLTGKRAQIIYDYMIQDKIENSDTRIICISGTPAVNIPYELALLFNLLRPGSFPKSENEFNHHYVSTSAHSTLNLATKNMFQRRIMGLVSYYLGATPDRYATQTIQYVDVKMSKYHEEIYTIFEDYEEMIEKKKRLNKGKGQETYKSYTRQASNFVFPHINQDITGDNRPRPYKFRLNEGQNNKILQNAEDEKKIKSSNVQKYKKALETYMTEINKYFDKLQDSSKKKGYTLKDDYEAYKTKCDKNFNKFQKYDKKSDLMKEMIKCSSKLIAIIFNILQSKGPVLVYSNYVLMEGLEIFKVYLKYFGFNTQSKAKPGFGYVEYHGGIKDMKERANALKVYNDTNNIRGDKVKIIMISAAGAEGLSLNNCRQVHIMEPFWQEVRIIQMMGRAIRQCSHKDLPMKERHVDVFRYKSIRSAKHAKLTTDQRIEDRARSKTTLIGSFLDAVREVAIDCKLNQEHNKLIQEYKCFQFDETSLFDTHIGPAYKEDMYDDIKIDNGSNSNKFTELRIKVMKIQAVKKLKNDPEPKYSKPTNYWYYEESGVVYDYDLKYAIGKVAYDENGIPQKLSKDVYIIDKLIPIPMIDEQLNDS